MPTKNFNPFGTAVWPAIGNIYFDDVKSDTWFNTVGSGEHRLTRLTADPLNLMPSRSRLELRANFFSQRVVNLWNSLPGEVKNARNPKMFKNIYQRYAGDIV